MTKDHSFGAEPPRQIATQSRYEEQRARLRHARAPLHMLLVDDDPVTQHLVKSLFSGRYIIVVCGDVRHAADEYLRVMPDLVFLDIDLGDNSHNGLDVLHTIHLIDPKAYVIMFSGHTDPAILEAAARGGAYGFIPKPFQSSRLIQAAHECEEIKNRREYTWS